jgi:hypothetical protein
MYFPYTFMYKRVYISFKLMYYRIIVPIQTDVLASERPIFSRPQDFAYTSSPRGSSDCCPHCPWISMRLLVREVYRGEGYHFPHRQQYSPGTQAVSYPQPPSCSRTGNRGRKETLESDVCGKNIVTYKMYRLLFVHRPQSFPLKNWCVRWIDCMKYPLSTPRTENHTRYKARNLGGRRK